MHDSAQCLMCRIITSIARQGAFSLSEAGSQVSEHSLKSPDCGRYRSLSLGLCKASLSEAVPRYNPKISIVQVELSSTVQVELFYA